MSHKEVKKFIPIVRKEIERQSVNNKLKVSSWNNSVIEIETSDYLKFLENVNLK
jgi:hypothetical protein